MFSHNLLFSKESQEIVLFTDIKIDSIDFLFCMIWLVSTIVMSYTCHVRVWVRSCCRLAVRSPFLDNGPGGDIFLKEYHNMFIHMQNLDGLWVAN